MKISIEKIDNNPHRNMKRNPISKDQVATIVASIKRNEWGENVIVRKHPDKKGRYQLAYGHHRLAALKQLKVKEAEFIVKDVDEWVMYTWMVDENESQQRVTPELVYENIEAGINYLEPVIRECETVEDFNQVVYRNTTSPLKDGHYSEVRNAVLSGEGLGVSFLSKTLPGNKSTARNNIQAVVDSLHAATKAKAKEKRAQAKRKQAEAAKDAAEADRLEQEAQELEEAARKLKDYGVSQDILLTFDSNREMTGFAEGVKGEGIPRKHHSELAAHLRSSKVAGRDYRKAIKQWWFVASGKASKQRHNDQRDKFRKKHKQKSLDDFAGELVYELRDMLKKVNSVVPFAQSIENSRTRSSLEKVALDVELAMNELGAALQDADDALLPGVPRIGVA
jgi:hypothetical protein